MGQKITFGSIVKERRQLLGLTQAELGRRVGCAAITIRKIEADALRPSVQIAEHLAVALKLPEEEHLPFVRLARIEQEPVLVPTPPPVIEEIGQEDLSGRAIRGFELAERIGTGGYGVVYRARQTVVSRDVAIKIILPQFANRPEFIRRFEAEAQLVARLEHPHIVPLYDYWREPGVAYLVMRLLRRGSLETLLQAGPPAGDVILRLMEQICAGLHVAHRTGVIHRDLKPANILLDDDGNAYLADFGIAKQMGNGSLAEATMEGMALGSPAYISPEQILAEPVKPQTDIYSLGILLYELLTGHKPFKGPTPFAFIQQHLHEPLPLLAAVQNGGAANPPASPLIPTALDVVIGRATAKDPRDRYPDSLTLLADLRKVMTAGSAAALLATGQASEAIPAHIATMIELPNLQNPYKGLRPFMEADAADFFGRETLVQDLLARMAESHDLARFLAVIGPSGSGKSSVVRAGLVPALRQGGLPGSENWFITEMLPGLHPFEELETALLRVAVNPPATLLAQLREDDRGLLRAVRRILPADEVTELVLVIDQFEEVFTLVEDEAARMHLLNSLVTAVLDPGSRLRLIITLRADFTDQPLRYVDFGELVRQRSEFVLPLTPDELEQAITGPTERSGLSLEAGLASLIMREIGDQVGSLPLLQYALTELFERRQGRLLTAAAYRESGGVKGALARRADELYDGLNRTGQELARQLFLRLVTLGEGVEDTRRRVLRNELTALITGPISAATKEAGQAKENKPIPYIPGAAYHALRSGHHEQTTMSAIIDLFGRYRLLTFDHDPITRGPTVEVAHEALLREWSRLREWLNSSRADIRLQRLLANASAEWLEAGQEASYLLRGSRLDQFAGWAAHTSVALTEDEQAYLEASLAARQARRAEEEMRQRRELETAQKLAETEARRAAEQARANRRLRWLAVGLAIFLIAATGAAWAALRERNAAENNFRQAERIRLAAQAQIALDNGEGGDLPALLALRSLQYEYSPEAEAALLSALRRGFTRQRYVGHVDDIRSVDFSPDGRYLLTASNDRTARLWEVQTGRELHRFSGHTAAVNAAFFSPDGRYILTGSLDNSARLWEAESGQELRRFTDHTGGVWGIDFTPDNHYFISSDGSLARLWDIQTGTEVRQFSGHTGAIFWLDISLDGRYLATFSNDKTARLWDVQTGQELRQFTGHTDWVGGGQLSADGRYLLTTSADQTARLWDTQTGREIRRFVGHTDDLFDGRFSPDGRYVLTTSYDKTARLWDIASGREVRQFLGHTDFIGTPAFSSDGRYILTGSGDRTARLWEVWPESEPKSLISFVSDYHLDLYNLNLSPDQQLLLTGFTDGAVKIWNLSNGKMVRDMNLKTTTINAQAISADNKLVLAGDNQGYASLAEMETGQVITRFEGHTGPIWEVTFSPDGAYALSGSEDQTARRWALQQDEQEAVEFAGHSGPVRAVAFSPDGQLVLTGSDDGTARLWNAQSGQEVRQFAGHSAAVLDVAFSKDGRFILTGSADNSARRWDVETGQELQKFVGHTEQVSRIAFAPDGRTVLTGSTDRTVRLWDAETGQVVRQLVGHASPILFIDFSNDGRSILSGDARTTLVWQARLEDVIEFSCAQLTRDFTDEERNRYNISDAAPTCANLAEQMVEVEPTWTPVPPGSIKMLPLVLAVEMEFVSEAVNIGMGMPIQDVFIDAGNGQVVRPEVINAETLALPVYRSAVEVEMDIFEAPFEAGPYPKGEPLGFTLGDYVAAAGRGAYTVQGDRAVVELTFDRLVPNGLYTLWCNTLLFSMATIEEYPCLAPDGSEYSFTADENGHAEIRMEIEAFPPSTEDTVYEIAIAYHSDGQTHGSSVGEHGRNAHGQAFFDFMPPVIK